METAITSGTLTSLPGRYAKALFDLAQEKSQVDDVSTTFNSLDKIIQSSRDLQHVLGNPTISRDGQAAVLKEICVRLKAPDVFRSFVVLLIKAQRISYLSNINQFYQSLVSQVKKEQKVEVISAHPLTASQSNLLKEKLKKIFPGSLTLTFVNDSRVLGGIMVRMGSRVVDATLATQLHQLATVMKGSA